MMSAWWALAEAITISHQRSFGIEGLAVGGAKTFHCPADVIGIRALAIPYDDEKGSGSDTR